jgi:hypothetical protein
MTSRALALAVALTLAVTAAVAAQAPAPSAVAGSASAATYNPPRTPWGDPDLQGFWPGVDMVGVPLQRQPPFGTRNTLTEQEYQQRIAAARRAEENALEEIDVFTVDVANAGAVGSPTSPPPHWLERGKPSRQASLIVDPPDGRQPPLAPEGEQRGASQRAEQQARRQRLQGREADTYLDRSLYDRCITRGPIGSILPVIYNNGNEIVQAPGYVAIRNEMIHETRIVPLDGRPHVSPAIRSYMGDSRGRWDGNTLVVETTNLNGRTGAGPNGGGQTSDRITLIERFTLLDKDMLQYQVTVDDPGTWTRPWTIQFPWRREPVYGMFEYACHEGNYAMFNILSGSRAAESGR